MVRRTALLLVSAALFVLSTALPAAAFNPDTRVSIGSPAAPFSQNKQNEPAVAIDANDPTILAAGANDNIDLEACNAGNDTTCPFTPDVGTLIGPIGTVPNYFENGLVSDGDPAVAFGPTPGANGGFSWGNGERLYYANLTANSSGGGVETFRGFEGIGVSSTDDLSAAAAGNNSAWTNPTIISRQSSTTFSDKEQIWADNASSSPFFGTVYVCWAAFMGQELSPNALPAGLQVAVSHDGGATWHQHAVGGAANNGQRNPLDGCTVRTDSSGAAYLFGIGTVSRAGHQAFELMSRSTNGGGSWSKPVAVAGPVTQPGVFDPAQGRPTIDSVAGARSDLAPAPSVDIANGAPTGTDATDRIVMSYVSGTLAQPHVYFTESTDHGATWSAPRTIETAGDRGYYAAPAISPNGTDVYVVYNAFTTPYHANTSSPNVLVGVVKHADVGGSGTGAFSELHRGTPGDARGSSANALSAEFLGDYVYAAATRTYGAAVWNDARNAADCPAIDAWRESLITGGTVARPAPQQDCPANFGNSNIYGGTFADPTP
ncbi:MAG: exo-alpha-sialidase [Actinobacteria bacterium]|nr:MAG: exo-alpha-sialidase [Actinomycetota bacterium]